jgi:hypothetical protein
MALSTISNGDTGLSARTAINAAIAQLNGLGPTSAVTITGGSVAGLATFGLRSTGAAFDLTLATSEALTAGRALSFNVGDANRTLTVPATGTVALLGTAQTFSAANVFSVNGAASTPALSVTGTAFTGGTATSTKPLFSIEPTGTTSNAWSTSGTMFGINAASGFTGNLIDLQKGASSKFSVDYRGTLVIGNGFNAGRGTYIDYFSSATIFITSDSADMRFGAASDLYFARRAAAYLGLGQASATPIAQTIGGAEGSGSNITGGALNFGTRGTGTGTGGVINLQTHAAGSSGAALGTLVNVLSIVAPGQVKITGIPTSSAGLASGVIYSNAGILTIVP